MLFRQGIILWNFVDDLIKRGYNPVVLESLDDSPELAMMRKLAASKLKFKPEVVHEKTDYRETLEMVRTYEPLFIVPGMEVGVRLATRLADDLGLPGNPYSNIAMMTEKGAMQEALERAGMRYIRGRKVKTVEEALEFYEENNLSEAVLKPPVGSCSQGMYFIRNKEELKTTASKILNADNVFGNRLDSVLIQERIRGTEYIVNTMSCNGKHRLNSILRYSKVETDEGRNVYESIEIIKDLEPGQSELVEYALKVADAIGYRYGGIHGEYMVDKKGPVLIEVNCRTMGCSMEAEYLDLIFGQHETDSVLDCFLEPERFAEAEMKPYRPLRYAAIKLIIVPSDIEIEDHPLWIIAKNLRSTYRIDAAKPVDTMAYKKTEDLETAGGLIFMLNKDESVLRSDLSILREIEQKYFGLLLNNGMTRKWFMSADTVGTDYSDLIRRCRLSGSTLIASDNATDITGTQSVTPGNTDTAQKGFENVILAFMEALTELKESESLKLIFRIMDLVKNGGRVIIPENTYRYLSYGREGAEELLRVKGFHLVSPASETCGIVIGVKEE